MSNLTNLVIQPVKADMSGFNQDIEKAHVKSYTRTSKKTGKTSMVQEHDDKRVKKIHAKKKKAKKKDYGEPHVRRDGLDTTVTYRGIKATYYTRDFDKEGIKKIKKEMDQEADSYEKWEKKKKLQEKKKKVEANKKDMRKPVSWSEARDNRDNEEQYDKDVDEIGWKLRDYENADIPRKKRIARKALDVMNKYGLTLEELCEKFTENRREARRSSGARHSIASLDIEDNELQSVMQLGKITRKTKKRTAKK